MRISMPALPDFTSDLARKIGLPVCLVGVLVIAGHIAGQTENGKKVHDRLLGEAAEPTYVQAQKGDRLPSLGDFSVAMAKDMPALPPELVAAASKVAAIVPMPVPAPKPAKPRNGVTMPVGVERFDNCTGACDSRDPLRKGAAGTGAAGTGAPVTAAARPPAAAPTVPAAPTLVVADAREAEAGYRMPDLLGESKTLIDRTVSATSETVDKMKQGVQSVLDVVW